MHFWKKKVLERTPEQQRYIREYMKEWRKENKEHTKLWKKSYREKNKKKLLRQEAAGRVRNQRMIAYCSYRDGAVKRNLAFELTFEEFKGLQDKACTYCGDKTKLYRGVDRLDSSRGYVRDNVAPCCKFCNIAKSDYDVDTFITNCVKVAKRHGRYTNS